MFAKDLYVQNKIFICANFVKWLWNTILGLSLAALYAYYA